MRKIVLSFFIIWTMVSLQAENLPFLQRNMIWSVTDEPGEQTYVAFRKKFTLDNPISKTELEIFADSRYMLWINGQYVLRGPCRFNPKRPEYDVVSVDSYLRQGENCIVVLVHHYGDVTNGRIMRHIPGLGICLRNRGKEVLKSDTSWKYSNHTRYTLAPESWNTIPDRIDGRIDNEEWMHNDFDDSHWSRTIPVDGSAWGKMFPREIPLASETVLDNLTILPSKEKLLEKLPLSLKEGEEAIVDYGTMAAVYTDITLDADENSLLTMNYGLRYKEGKVNEMFGSGNHYITRQGLQHFITTDQWISHYMVIKCVRGNITLNELKLVNRSYPFKRLGSFVSNDDFLNRFWQMAVKTIEVTADDAYGTDARERNEWTQDCSKPSFQTSRVALTSTNKVDAKLLKNLLRHGAQSQLPDGNMLGTFPTDRGPADCHYIIEDYSCQWFEALKNYYELTGDKAFVEEMWGTLTAQMNKFISQITPRGLLFAREYCSFDNPMAYIHCEGATLNAFFYEALRASQYLAHEINRKEEENRYRTLADKLYQAFNQALWNEEAGAYNAAWEGDKCYDPTVHSQMIPLVYGLVPKEREKSSQKFFLDNYKNKGSKCCCVNERAEEMIAQKSGIEMPIEYFWVLKLLYSLDEKKYDEEALDEIRRRWNYMVNLQSDAGTLSEGFVKADGSGTEESCHNYGSTPAYYLSSYVLGVRSYGSVFEEKLLIEPRLGDLTHAKGEVVTEYGVVPVFWEKKHDTLFFNFSLPEGVTGKLHLPLPAVNYKVILNGKTYTSESKNKKMSTEGRWIVIEDCKGNCKGSVSVNT